MSIWALAGHKLTTIAPRWWMIHNLFRNGFSEVCYARGVLLFRFRAGLDTDWAQVLQALVFATLHVGGTIPEEPA